MPPPVEPGSQTPSGEDATKATFTFTRKKHMHIDKVIWKNEIEVEEENSWSLKSLGVFKKCAAAKTKHFNGDID